MPIQLTLEQQTLRFDSDTIGIGTAPENQISLPADTRLARVHAVLRSVNGRWIIESREGGPLRVGNGRPAQFAWVNPGDLIHLTDSGPVLKFELLTASGAPAPASPAVSPPAVPQPLPIREAAALPPPVPRPLAVPAPTSRVIEPNESSASGNYIPADDWRIWVKPIAIMALSSVVLLAGMFFWPRSKPLSPMKTDDLEFVEASPVIAPVPDESPLKTVSAVAADPGELLVLIGIGDLRSGNRPHVLGVGWLWDERTAVVSRMLGDFVNSLLADLKSTAPRQACVIQGISLEISRIDSPTTCPEISIVRLKDAAELTFPVREQWQLVSEKDIERRRGLGRKLKRISFPALPKSPAVQKAKAESTELTESDLYAFSLSWQAYDPEVSAFAERAEDEARLVFEQDHHFLNTADAASQLERVGLVISDDRKIVGMTLPDSSVVWTNALQRALQSPSGSFKK